MCGIDVRTNTLLRWLSRTIYAARRRGTHREMLREMIVHVARCSVTCDVPVRSHLVTRLARPLLVGGSASTGLASGVVRVWCVACVSVCVKK
eukprot:6020652-Prymnesium_polylepis.1